MRYRLFKLFKSAADEDSIKAQRERLIRVHPKSAPVYLGQPPGARQGARPQITGGEDPTPTMPFGKGTNVPASRVPDPVKGETVAAATGMGNSDMNRGGQNMVLWRTRPSGLGRVYLDQENNALMLDPRNSRLVGRNNYSNATRAFREFNDYYSELYPRPGRAAYDPADVEYVNAHDPDKHNFLYNWGYTSLPDIIRFGGIERNLDAARQRMDRIDAANIRAQGDWDRNRNKAFADYMTGARIPARRKTRQGGKTVSSTVDMPSGLMTRPGIDLNDLNQVVTYNPKTNSYETSPVSVNDLVTPKGELTRIGAYIMREQELTKMLDSVLPGVGLRQGDLRYYEPLLNAYRKAATYGLLNGNPRDKINYNGKQMTPVQVFNEDPAVQQVSQYLIDAGYDPGYVRFLLTNMARGLDY